MSLLPYLRNYIDTISLFWKEFQMAESKVERQKAKSKGFAALGVPVGSTLTFRKDPAVTCKTVDEKNKVEYQGKVYPISGLAKELMNTAISGYHAFKYNGTLLAKLDGAKPETTTSPVPATTKPADTAQVAPPAATPPTPQTVPLPKPQDAPVTPPEANSASTEADAQEVPLDPLAGYPPEDDVAPTEA
jgi:hypothetical protein